MGTPAHDLVRRVGKNWAYKSRNVELAVLYELLVNWWTAPTTIIEHSSEQKQDFVGISDMEILSVIAYLATNAREVRESFFPCFGIEDLDGSDYALSMREKILALLEI